MLLWYACAACSSGAGLTLSDTRLKETKWRLADGELLWLLTAGDRTRLMDGRATVVTEIAAPDYVEEVIVSGTSTCLLLRIMRRTPGAVSHYSRLLRITRARHSPWVAEPILQRDTSSTEPQRWIVELGAISDSGRMALLKIGELDSRTSRLTYSWQTWLLDSARKVSEGRSLPAHFNE